MSARTASWLAWSLWALTVGVAGLYVVLTLLSFPHRDAFDVDDPSDVATNALTLLAFVTVGALVISRHSRNAIGWIFYSIGLLMALGGFADQ